MALDRTDGYLQFSGNLGYVHPHYSSFRLNATAAGDIANTPGVRYSNLTRWTYNLAADYTFLPMDFGTLSARVNWSHRGLRYSGVNSLPTNFVEQVRDPGYDDVSAQITLADIPISALSGKATLAVYGANLLNEHPVLQGTDLGTYGVKLFGPGRSFGVSLTTGF